MNLQEDFYAISATNKESGKDILRELFRLFWFDILAYCIFIALFMLLKMA